MKVTLEDDVVDSLESLTGKKITRNGNAVIREVVEIAENTQKPDAPCWMESSCSEQDEEVEA